ncbi:helix-turn-helix domain-containing protein [Halobacteriovorax marinus]|uniref:DnaA/Hda family protein n=1 Tax=Halobacteriovorax marinus TaxID=97084 RepID=UPI003A94ABED
MQNKKSSPRAAAINKKLVRNRAQDESQLDLLSYISNQNIAVSRPSNITCISSAKRPKAITRNRKFSLPINVDRNKVFKNFICGESNSRAYKVMESTLNSKNIDYQIIYICSLSGLGKSHLLYATANALFEKTAKKICYFHGKEFIYNFDAQVENLDSIAAVFVDDLDEITYDIDLQDRFSRNFDLLKRSGVQIFLAGSILPKHMKMANAKYANRVGGALVEKINKIDRDLASKILDNLSTIHNYQLSPDVSDLLVDCFHYHVYGLESALLKLKSYSETFSSNVDIKIALKELKILGPVLDKNINSKKIICRVCEFYKVDVEDLFSKNRKKEVSFARHVCMYILKDRNGLSLSRIARLFNRDHTSVLYGVNKVMAEIQNNKKFRKDIHELV